MAFCANCGAAVTGKFCQQCGTPLGAPGSGPATPPPGPNPPGRTPPVSDPLGVHPLPPPVVTTVAMNDNMAGALCYLFGFITGILFLVLAPYNQDRKIRFHAFQSIFLNIAWVIMWIVVTIVLLPFRFIPFLGLFIAVVLHSALGLGGLFIWLYMMFKTYNGEKIVLPVIGPLAEKQAGVFPNP